MNKTRSIHTVEYYSGRKRNEVLLCATMWMNLVHIMLRESQTQKPVVYDFADMQRPEQASPLRQETHGWWPGAGGGLGSECSRGWNFLLGDRDVLERGRNGGCTTLCTC